MFCHSAGPVQDQSRIPLFLKIVSQVSVSYRYRLIAKCISGKKKSLKRNCKREMKKMDVKHNSIQARPWGSIQVPPSLLKPKGILSLFSKATFVGVAEPRQNQATLNQLGTKGWMLQGHTEQQMTPSHQSFAQGLVSPGVSTCLNSRPCPTPGSLPPFLPPSFPAPGLLLTHKSLATINSSGL